MPQDWQGRSRALKFIAKARSLDPSLPTDDLLSSLEKEEDASSSSPSPVLAPDQAPSTADEPKLWQRSKSPASSFTEEQITIVRQINLKKHYDEIQGLQKSCTIDDVRKAYQKLSLSDKNIQLLRLRHDWIVDF